MHRSFSLKELSVEPAYQLSRRKFLQAALVAVAASGSGIACSGEKSPWSFLTVSEARTLAAACDQIIPTDEDSGAAWAAVVTYIDRQLCGPLKDLQNTYRWGIAAMDRSSRILYASAFAEIPGDKQIELLARMEHGHAPAEAWKKIRSTEFFGHLLDQTMQGFYGDPRHGGNRDGVSWTMLGLTYPPIRGQLHYDLSKS